MVGGRRRDNGRGIFSDPFSEECFCYFENPQDCSKSLPGSFFGTHGTKKKQSFIFSNCFFLGVLWEGKPSNFELK